MIYPHALKKVINPCCVLVPCDTRISVSLTFGTKSYPIDSQDFNQGYVSLFIIYSTLAIPLFCLNHVSLLRHSQSRNYGGYCIGAIVATDKKFWSLGTVFLQVRTISRRPLALIILICILHRADVCSSDSRASSMKMNRTFIPASITPRSTRLASPLPRFMDNYNSARLCQRQAHSLIHLTLTLI